MRYENSRIMSFTTCSQCQRDKPGNESMEKWARLNVGLTETGLEVWCVRHRRVVVHFTPDQLQGFVEGRPGCECCPEGRHDESKGPVH